MNKTIFRILILFISTTVAFAQNANRKYENFKEDNNTLEIKTSDGVYRIKSYAEKIVETSFIPNGETYNPNSHAVVLVPKTGISKVTEDSNSIRFTTKGIVVA
ncbi:MAG: glycosyl hydrolase, partial [Flavobacterium sp.]